MFGADAAALRRGHRQRVELAVLHLRQRRKQIVGQDLDVAGEGCLQRRAGAAERHMHHLQSRQLQQPGHGEVRALPDAGGAIGQLVRIGLDVGDHLGDRLDRHRGMRRDDVGDPDQVGDRLQLIGLVVQVAVDAVGDGVGAGIADQDGVAVALLARHFGGADGAAGAGAVFHDRGLAPGASADAPPACVPSRRCCRRARPARSGGRFRSAASRRQGSRAAGWPPPKSRRPRSARGGGKAISWSRVHSLLDYYFCRERREGAGGGKRQLGAGRKRRAMLRCAQATGAV